jgi:hypothetical protein
VFFTQIGHIDVLTDVSYSSQNRNLTFGSGGGAPGAGRGGGRIVIRASKTVTITSTGVLAADGSEPSSAGLGAGSGGAVVVYAHSVSQLGLVTALGGNQPFDPKLGGAGGGGRIEISVRFNMNSSSQYVCVIYSCHVRIIPSPCLLS